MTLIRRMRRGWKVDLCRMGKAKLKPDLENVQRSYDEEMSKMRLENAALKKKVEELSLVKAWFLSEGTQSLARYIHKGPELKEVVVTVNNSVNAVGMNVGVRGDYMHALHKKTPFREVLLLTKDVDQLLDAAIKQFDKLTFPMVESLATLAKEPHYKIQEVVGFIQEILQRDQV
ncbi:hypothetical protein HanHA89_Chr12g0475351 [Helianthus annuus]|nr:hypothetical protein HanHA89_Chr12g0475351 [Helianthus annuus]